VSIGQESFKDGFVQQLLLTKALRRLQDVTFLGAIDYLQPSNGHQTHRRRNNRFEHTLGVTRLVASYCDAQQLDAKDFRPFIAAALLHDIGHGPLSHTLEPIFKAHFGIDHHSVGVSYLRGKGSVGEELDQLLRFWNVDRERVIEIVEGRSTEKHSKLFSSTHNVDTIEAITRSLSMVRRSLAPRSAEFYFSSLWLSEDFSLSVGDDFWKLKDTVYHVFINGMAGRFMDSVAQSFMTVNLDAFSEADFKLTDRKFMRKFRKLHKILLHVLPLARFQAELDEKMLSANLVMTRRRFIIDETKTIESKRYKQIKKKFDWYLSDHLKSSDEKSLIQHQLELGEL
jgi:uncharacterized protein